MANLKCASNNNAQQTLISHESERGICLGLDLSHGHSNSILLNRTSLVFLPVLTVPTPSLQKAAVAAAAAVDNKNAKAETLIPTVSARFP